MAVDVGDLLVQIRLEQRELVTGLRRAESRIKRFEKQGTKSFAGMTDAAGALQGAVAGVAGSMALLAAAGTARALFDTGRAVARLETSFTAVEGSAEAAAFQMNWLRTTANRLGQNFYDLAPAYQSFLAASKTVNISAMETQNIFESVVQAGASLSLTSEDMEGALRALSQMMSKGNVQAEELRGQLGERIPGAFGLAAEAMGVTTGELNKMLEQGEVLAADLLPKLADVLKERYSGEVSEATRASNRLRESWTDFKAEVADGAFMDASIAALNAASDAIESNTSALRGLKVVLNGIGIDGERVFSSLGDSITETFLQVLPGGSIIKGLLRVKQELIEVGVASQQAEDQAVDMAAQLNAASEEMRELNEERRKEPEQPKLTEAEIKRIQQLKDARQDMIDSWTSAYNQATMESVDFVRWQLDQEREALIESEEYKTASIERRKELEDAYQKYRVQRLKEANDERRQEREAEQQELRDFIRDSRAMAEEVTLAGSELLRRQTERELEEYKKREEYKRATQEQKQQIDEFYFDWYEAKQKEISEMQREEEMDRLRNSREAADGVKRALVDIYDEITNDAQRAEEATRNIFSGIEDSLTEFLDTGEFKVEQFVDNTISALNRLAVQQAVIKPLAEGLLGGNLFGGTAQGGTGDAAGGGFFSSLLGGAKSLFGFAGGGSFPVNSNTSVGSLPGVDNRLIAFKARDGEQVSVTTPTQRSQEQPVQVNYNIQTPDVESFRRSQGQILNRTQAALSRARRRNG